MPLHGVPLPLATAAKAGGSNGGIGGGGKRVEHSCCVFPPVSFVIVDEAIFPCNFWVECVMQEELLYCGVK